MRECELDDKVYAFRYALVFFVPCSPYIWLQANRISIFGIFFVKISYRYIHPWTELVYQILESKKALFYIFDFTGSVFENSKKHLF